MFDGSSSRVLHMEFRVLLKQNLASYLSVTQLHNLMITCLGFVFIY